MRTLRPAFCCSSQCDAAVLDWQSVNGVGRRNVSLDARPHPGPLPRGEGEQGSVPGKLVCVSRDPFILRPKTKGVRIARALPTILPLLGERAGVRASVPLTSFLAFVVLFCSLVAFTPHARASEAASGPEISVPKDLPRKEDHKLPERNWIDQTQTEADRKSRGCLECHSGSEPM